MSVAEIYKQVLEGEGEFGVPTKSFELDPVALASVDKRSFVQQVLQTVEDFVKQHSDDPRLVKGRQQEDAFHDCFAFFSLRMWRHPSIKLMIVGVRMGSVVRGRVTTIAAIPRQ